MPALTQQIPPIILRATLPLIGSAVSTKRLLAVPEEAMARGEVQRTVETTTMTTTTSIDDHEKHRKASSLMGTVASTVKVWFCTSPPVQSSSLASASQSQLIVCHSKPLPIPLPAASVFDNHHMPDTVPDRPRAGMLLLRRSQVLSLPVSTSSISLLFVPK